jgi:hypothetical protein
MLTTNKNILVSSLVLRHRRGINHTERRYYIKINHYAANIIFLNQMLEST